MPRNATLLLLALTACTTHEEESEPAAVVACSPVVPARVVDHLLVRGPIRPPPDRDAPIAAQLGGAVLAVRVREGDLVAVGSVLVDLDDRTQRADVDSAEAVVEAVRARAYQAHEAATRKAALQARGIASLAEVQAVDADAAQAEADVVAASTALRAARAYLGRAHITSPIAGRVLALHVLPGQVVDVGAPLVDVVDPAVLELVATVGVADLARLASGQSAEITVDGLPDWTAVVSAVAPGVDAITGLGTVRIRLDDRATAPVGAVATARVGVAEHDGWLVPEGAIRSGPTGHQVVLCVGNVARTLEVEVGESTDAGVEIRGDVPPGARVIEDGALPIDDGAPIEVAP